MISLNWPAIGAVILPNVGGWLIMQRCDNDLKVWYKTVKMPLGTPPDWVYALMGFICNSVMGYAAYMVWRDSGRELGGAAALPLALYASQYALDLLWTEIFFKLHSFKWSFLEMVLLDVNVAACGLAFYRVNKTAGSLVAPMMAWLMYTTQLQYRLYRSNPKALPDKEN